MFSQRNNPYCELLKLTKVRYKQLTLNQAIAFYINLNPERVDRSMQV